MGGRRPASGRAWTGAGAVGQKAWLRALEGYGVGTLRGPQLAACCGTLGSPLAGRRMRLGGFLAGSAPGQDVVGPTEALRG